ncbi:Imm45 family immunity protein [Nocardia sp. NPDC057030]|uniref:Imm45 family immunity protein n=1 Tax=unclassified Nocardia TaxID=2637762 RepID=UPI00363F9A21
MMYETLEEYRPFGLMMTTGYKAGLILVKLPPESVAEEANGLSTTWVPGQSQSSAMATASDKVQVAASSASSVSHDGAPPSARAAASERTFSASMPTRRSTGTLRCLAATTFSPAIAAAAVFDRLIAPAAACAASSISVRLAVAEVASRGVPVARYAPRCVCVRMTTSVASIPRPGVSIPERRFNPSPELVPA